MLTKSCTDLAKKGTEIEAKRCWPSSKIFDCLHVPGVIGYELESKDTVGKVHRPNNVKMEWQNVSETLGLAVRRKILHVQGHTLAVLIF